MGINLGIRSETQERFDDRSWLGSAHGTEVPAGVTLDGAAFKAVFADGLVPSGVIASKNSTSGLYEPGHAGDEPGHLLEPVDVIDTDDATPANPTASILWHGRVYADRLPANSQFDTLTTPDALPHIVYVDVPAV